MNDRLREQAALEMQADKIEAILLRHGMNVRITGGTVTPRLTKYEVSGPGVSTDSMRSLCDEIRGELEVYDVRVYQQAGATCIEVPRAEPRLLRIDRLFAEMGQMPPMTAVLGKEGTRPLRLRITGNVLVSGDSGAGKTALLRSMMASLAYYNRTVQFVLLDPKVRGLKVLTRLPNTHWFESAPDAWRCLSNQREPTIVIVDELTDVGGIPEHLLAHGPRAGIHFIAATQKPLETVYGQPFGVHIAGQAEKSPYPDCGRLMGRGDFQLFTYDQRLRFQAAWLGSNEMKSIVKEIWGI